MSTRRTFIKLGLGVAAALAAASAGGYLYWFTCVFPKRERLSFGAPAQDAVIGVVRTDSVSHTTRVHYLSRDLSVTGSVRIARGEVGDARHDTCVSGTKLVLPAASSKSLPQYPCVLNLDLTTQELTTWRADNPQFVAASDTHIFTSDVMRITALDVRDDTQVSFGLSDEDLQTMLWHDGSLWAVGGALFSGELVLRQFSEALEPLRALPLEMPADADPSIKSLAPWNLVAHGESLYLTASAYGEFGGAYPWGRVCRIDAESLDCRWIALGDGQRETKTLAFADGKLFALQGRTCTEGPARLCSFDEDGRPIAQSEVTGDDPRQLAVVDGTAYLNTKDGVHALDAKTLDVRASVNLDPEGESYENTGLFAVPRI